MTVPMPARRYKRGVIKVAEMCAWDAVSALTFITDADHWPAFVAWAEQLEPDEPWTEDDYNRMVISAHYFLDFAEQAEQMLGGPSDAG